MKFSCDRKTVLLTIFALWFIVIVLYLLNYTVLAREYYLSKGNILTLRHGTIYAPRGRILDKNKNVLSSCSMQYEISIKPGLGEIERKAIKNSISLILYGKNSESSRSEIILPLTVSNQILHKILGDSEIAEKLQIAHILKCTKSEPLLDDYTGHIELVGNKLKGTGGLEMQYDKKLSGRNGEYIVKVDRKGNWINSTFKLLVTPTRGSDVVLKKSKNEILNVLKNSN